MAYSLIDDRRSCYNRGALPALCGVAALSLLPLHGPPASLLSIKAATAQEADVGNLSVSAAALPRQGEASAPKPNLGDELENVQQRMLFLTQLNGGFAVENISGAAGKALPVRIVLSQTIDSSYSFLMFRGLPKEFTLSHGFATKDAWAVSLHDIGHLELITPPNFEGAFKVEVLLIRGQDMPLERRVMAVQLKSAESPAVAQTSAQFHSQSAAKQQISGAEATASVKPAYKMDDNDRAAMDRAEQLVQSGDIAAARLIFTRLAKKGSAAAAMSMAKTFDPEFLRMKRVAGLQPDVAQAKYWYEKAIELGNQDAVKRLLALNASGQ